MSDKYLNNLLGDNEIILLETRQHWLILLQEILTESVMALVVFVFVTMIWILWVPNVLMILGYFILIIPLLSLARDLFIWLNHKYVVTNRRVIQLSGLFNKNVIDSSLEKVNDVKMHQSFLGRMLGYGDIEILTASELGVNVFRRIWRPIRFKTAMLNAKEKLEMEHAGGVVEVQPPADIPAMIAQLDKLRQQGVLSEEEFQAKKADLLKRL